MSQSRNNKSPADEQKDPIELPRTWLIEYTHLNMNDGKYATIEYRTKKDTSWMMALKEGNDFLSRTYDARPDHIILVEANIKRLTGFGIGQF